MMMVIGLINRFYRAVCVLGEKVMKTGAGIGAQVECSWCGSLARKRGTKAGVFCDNGKCQRDHHAAKKGAITTIELVWLLIEQGLKCAYCDRRLPPDIMEPDHIHPRNKGGLDHISNIKVSCPSCNKSKGNRPVQMFLATGLIWSGAPSMTSNQAALALLYYAHHKRIAARCRGILDMRIEPITANERAVCEDVLAWLINNEGWR